MIPVSNCQDFNLEQSWKTHKRADRLKGLPPASANLLLFYAVECGLKSLLLKTRNLTTCPKNRDNLLYSHDLAKILREMCPSRAEIGTAPFQLHLDLKSGNMRHQVIGDIHSVWRYGLSIDPKNERDVIDWLRKIDRYITSKRRQS